MFLHVITHNLKFRVIRGIYIRSTETISRHFSTVLNGILSLAGDYIKIPESTNEIGADDKWKWFRVSNIIFIYFFHVSTIGRITNVWNFLPTLLISLSGLFMSVRRNFRSSYSSHTCAG